jgi:predicted Zn-dependent protease
MGRPEADGLFLSAMSTLRGLKPSEYPLAEPYRIKVFKAGEADRSIDEYAKLVPVERYKKEELLLLNGLYPDRKPAPGDYVKVIE